MLQMRQMTNSRIRSRRRGGFTLIETIVTVGLIAVIAAFVIPTVIQKAGSGDPVKVQNDLNTVRTAIETFATDVKSGFPRKISILTSPPVAGTDRFIDSLAGERPVYSTDQGEAELAYLLAGWRDEVLPALAELLAGATT